jgi:putative ATPase
MKDIGYGKDYKYAHSYKNNFVQDNFMPEELKDNIIYTPQNNSKESDIFKRLQMLWKGKYNY